MVKLKDFTELLHIAVGVLVTSLVIAVSVMLFRIGSSVVRNFTNSITDKNAAVEEADYTKYTNGECTGSDVVSAIRKYRDKIVIHVQTRNTPTGVHNFSSSSLDESFQNLPTNPDYINPGASFNCTITRSANDNITGLVFKQTVALSIVSADIHEVAEEGGTGTGGGAAHSPAGGGVPASYSLYDDFSGSPSSDASSDEDLEVLFSDEESGGSYGSEASQFVKDLSKSIMEYSSQLDDLVQELNDLNVEETNSSILSGFVTRIEVLSNNLDGLEAKCNSAFLTKDLQKKYKDMLKKVKQNLQDSIDVVNGYKRKLARLKDRQDTWYVGSPVREDVKVVLSDDGTLTFSGKGAANTGHDLPKWLSRKKDIRKVVWGDEVSPVNVDYWFSGCINLKTVEKLPDSVVSMNGVFFDCPNLSGRVVLGDCVTSANAFRNTGNDTLTLVVSASSQTMETIEAYLSLDVSKNANIKMEER